MRFQSTFPTILVTLLLGSTAQAFAQGTGDYAAPIPGPDIRAGLAARDDFQSGRSTATIGSAVSVSPWWRHAAPASTEPRQRHPGKKLVD
jgi:hypothetical protein